MAAQLVASRVVLSSTELVIYIYIYILFISNLSYNIHFAQLLLYYALPTMLGKIKQPLHLLHPYQPHEFPRWRFIWRLTTLQLKGLSDNLIHCSCNGGMIMVTSQMKITGPLAVSALLSQNELYLYKAMPIILPALDLHATHTFTSSG
jgi:hypothetical protein